jgi:hypothetical protein
VVIKAPEPTTEAPELTLVHVGTLLHLRSKYSISLNTTLPIPAVSVVGCTLLLVGHHRVGLSYYLKLLLRLLLVVRVLVLLTKKI